MSEPIIAARGLTRRFGAFTAVDGVDLAVEPGSDFAFLGANGSGKSTTIRMLTTLLPPTSGDALVDGRSVRDPWEVRRRIGVVFQDPSLDLRLTTFENLDFYLALHRPDWSRRERRARVVAALDTLGIADRARDEVRTLSWGTRRRAEVARALLTDPAILFLDEPTTGLDPPTRAVLWEHLLALRAGRELTLFVATHDMEEAARCERVGVIHEGRLLAVGTAAEVCAAAGAPDLGAAFLALVGRPAAGEGAGGSLPRGRDGTAWRRG